mgnify:CR=1 FL=1
MPYISPTRRNDLAPFVGSMCEAIRYCPVGDLNYTITRIVDTWVQGRNGKGYARYEDYNAALGVLEAAKLELYRRMVGPYEDTKAQENGDVYGK